MTKTVETKSPRGVTGEQREKFLGLTEDQRQVYRYHFDVCGRLAEHCYKIASGEWAGPRYGSDA